MAEQYSDPIVRKYMALIKASTGGKFKAFFEGDPIKVPGVDVPCIIITKLGTRVGVFSNSQDQHEIGMRITVITDVRKDLSTAEDEAKIAAGISSLYDLVEGRNEDYSLKDGTILDILRSNTLVDAANNLRTDLGTLTSVDYSLTTKGRAAEEWQVEARIDFVAHFVQVR